MKFNLIIFSLLLPCGAFAERYVDIMPLQLQFRYQDSTNQEKEIVQYQSYSLAVQPSLFRFGIEFSQNENRSGNNSLTVSTESKEYCLSAGYQVFEISAPEKKRSLNMFVNGLLGTTQTTIVTQLLGSSANGRSDKNEVYGVGVALVGRAKYFLLETEFRLLNSKNFSPQIVPAALIKLGASIPY